MAYLSVTNHNARREGGDDPFVVTQGISLPSLSYSAMQTGDVKGTIVFNVLSAVATLPATHISLKPASISGSCTPHAQTYIHEPGGCRH